MPIRIMHVLDNLGRGGMQNGVVNLIAHLDPTRFEHVVCSTRYLEDEKSHRLYGEHVRVMCVGDRKAASRLQISALARAIREVKPNVIHSRNWGGVEAVVAGRWVGSASLVQSEHGLDPETVATEPWRRIAFRRLAFELADRVMCVSEQLKQIYSKRTGFPERRMMVIHNGVDTHKFSPDPTARIALRRELGISAGDYCIGCVGRLSSIKDYPTVIRAAGKLDESFGAWRLIVIGDGPERLNLEQILREHPQWGRKISFLGSNTRIAELLNAMDVYVLSSITEGISNALLEAMATGLPVIATATGGNPEVVVDGQSGILFDVGDTQQLAARLLLLQARPEERSRLGDEALHRVRENFSLETMVRRYENLYNSLAPQVKLRTREVACT
jgi:sugar transferase (PEP-CTERM/EpsH1 system associated)